MTHARYPSLLDRVVFITGGGSGIGAAMVEAFAAQGASVAFVDVKKAEALEVVERAGASGQKPLFIECDLTNLAQLEAAMEETRQRLGPISTLINNAANDTRQPFADVTEADWDRAMAVNLKHQFFAAQIAVRSMKEIGGGSIVNLSSVVWHSGNPNLAVYSSAKAAVIGFTNSLARELGPFNIRVNSIAPGAVMTERQRRLWFRTDADVAHMTGRQCLPFSIEPDAVASAALFLAADDSRMITKHCLVVDAGMR
ncbi:MAG: SDR family oxidoreductase [Bradyrhizobium sp.]|nr:MAG: SDR family oxidoreductase [Bradyrhizobium sp.]